MCSVARRLRIGHKQRHNDGDRRNAAIAYTVLNVGDDAVVPAVYLVTRSDDGAGNPMKPMPTPKPVTIIQQ